MKAKFSKVCQPCSKGFLSTENFCSKCGKPLTKNMYFCSTCSDLLPDDYQKLRCERCNTRNTLNQRAYREKLSKFGSCNCDCHTTYGMIPPKSCDGCERKHVSSYI